MSTRTELWVGASPPLEIPSVSLASLGDLPEAGPAVILVEPVSHAPKKTLSAVATRLRNLGRRIDGVIVAAQSVDLSDGLPCEVGVGAHRRVDWLEIADRLFGTPTADIALLRPDIPQWTPNEDLRGVRDPHLTDRAAAWVRVLSGRTSGPTSMVLESHRPLHPGRALLWLMQPWPGVVRARGFVWTLDRPGVVADLNRVGEHPSLTGCRNMVGRQSPSHLAHRHRGIGAH